MWNKVDSRFLTRFRGRDKGENEDVKNRCSHVEYFLSENLSHKGGEVCVTNVNPRRAKMVPCCVDNGTLRATSHVSRNAM